MTPLDPALVPVPLPHYRLRDDALWFLASRRPALRLDPAEREVWEAMDGAVTVADLVRRFPGPAEPALGRFLDAGLCLAVEAGFPAGRRRIAVFEPHMDDAALSLGGTLWRRRHECEFRIVTLAGTSNFTSYYYLDRDYFDVGTISALRRAESALLARAIGGRHVTCDLAEAPLRHHAGCWTPDWFRRHRASVSAFISRPSGPGELREWTEVARSALRGVEADEVWWPMGTAPHTDHELARNALLALLDEDPDLPRRTVVRLYQEVPYAARFPRATAEIVRALADRGAVLEPEAVPVDDAFADKLRLVALFGSQFKLAAMRPDVEASARAAAGAGGGRAELLYRVAAAPRRPDPASLSARAPEARRLADALGPWLERNRGARRVRLFLRPPSGRWAEDAAALLSALPRARLEVRASDEAIAEIREHAEPRIEVGPIGRGAPAWLLEIARANLRGPAPTLIVPFAERMGQARLLGRLLPGSDVLAAPDLDLLARALRLLEAGADRGARD